jgi:O-methyltransferase involved in polyketide biosynthesis
MPVGTSWDIVSGPGLTALGLASARAVESSMPDRLIDDLYVAGFVEGVHAPIPLPVRWPDAGATVSGQRALLLHGSRYIGRRSRYCEDHLWAAVADGARLPSTGWSTPRARRCAGSVSGPTWTWRR